VLESARAEFDRAPALGVLFVRLEHWGRVRDLYTWRELADVYRELSHLSLALVGRELRQLDLPTDLGLQGEGFAVVLSASRGPTVPELAAIEKVGTRVADRLREHFESVLPRALYERVWVECGASLLHAPGREATLEEGLIGALLAAEMGAKAAQEARIARLAQTLTAELATEPPGVRLQPVVDLAGRQVAGYDAMLPASVALGMVGDVVLDLAERSGHVYRFYDLYHQAALAEADCSLSAQEFVMLRVAASELLESSVRVTSLLHGLQHRRLSPGNVVFMLDGRETLAHFATGLLAARSVADMGFRIGLDLQPDAPLLLDCLRELKPSLVRVSGRGVRGLHRQQDEFELLLMLSRFASRHGMRLVAADCHEEAELAALRKAGAGLVQGECVTAREESEGDGAPR